MAELSLSGSCLCGDVEYEIAGTQTDFWHCHCERCRKATGTGHASNLIFMPVELRFTRGEENIARFKVPDAKFFTNVFCTHCGSRLPNYSTERGFAVVPAGSLDSDPGVQAGGRIFKGSAASWSCGDSDLPEFEKYAPRD